MEQKKKQQKKSNPTAIVLFLLALLICGGGYYIFLTFSIPVQEEASTPREISIQKKDWRKIIFEDKTYQDLKNPLPDGFSTGEKGNSSPFLE